MSPLSPFAPFKFLKANANVRACSVPPRVTVTSGVPVLASIVAVASVIVAAVPSVPFVPGLPASPLSPFSPLRFLKAKANVRACAVPPGVTVTSGVPVLASTVAVTDVISAAMPSSPLSPLSPGVPSAGLSI